MRLLRQIPPTTSPPSPQRSPREAEIPSFQTVRVQHYEGFRVQKQYQVGFGDLVLFLDSKVSNLPILRANTFLSAPNPQASIFLRKRSVRSCGGALPAEQVGALASAAILPQVDVQCFAFVLALVFVQSLHERLERERGHDPCQLQ